MTYYTVQEWKYDACVMGKDISHYTTHFSSTSIEAICKFLNELSDKDIRFLFVVQQEFDTPYRIANRGIETWDWYWWEFLDEYATT